MHAHPINKHITLGMLLCSALVWFTWCVPVHADSTEPDSAWRRRFERARTALVEERLTFARGEFETLIQTASSDQDRALARELLSVVRLKASQDAAEGQPEIRTDDELAILYTSAALYGLGTGGVVALQFEPQTLGGALLPFVIFGPAAIGGVALADSYRPFAHGVPHAIAAGLYLGLGEGLWVAGYQHAYAVRHDDSEPWRSKRVAMALWAGSTIGAVAGGLLGAIRRPTPGRVSFSASASIWAGALSAFAASALEPKGNRRAQTAYLIGAIGYNVGLLSGIVFGPSVAPSSARMRFVDLGGLAGALLGAGGYALVSRENNTRVTLATAAIGGVLGLGLSWWATSGMPPDRSHDALPSLLTRNTLELQPSLVPLPGGVLAGVTGRL